MARKPTAPPVAASLTREQMHLGIERIKRRIAEVEGFDPALVKERWAPETKALETAIDDTLSRVFGHNTPRYDRYCSAANLDRGGLVVGGGPDPLYKVHQWLTDGKADALALLNQAVKGLEEDLGETPLHTAAVANTRPSQTSATNDEVFIVHGRNEAAKTAVAHFLERAGLKVTILHEQPNAGQTIIEKFELHGGAAAFAVIVMTPDDVGGESSATLRQRARQNVIGEMFWFAAKLGRSRICALKQGDLELPSDFAGVGYTDMDDRGAWKQELLKELSAAGYTVNWGKALA